MGADHHDPAHGSVVHVGRSAPDRRDHRGLGADPAGRAPVGAGIRRGCRAGRRDGADGRVLAAAEARIPLRAAVRRASRPGRCWPPGVWAYLRTFPDEVLWAGCGGCRSWPRCCSSASRCSSGCGCKESPTFIELEKHEQIAEHPLPEVFRTARRQIFRGIGLRMAENGGSYLFSTLSITFVTSARSVSANRSAHWPSPLPRVSASSPCPWPERCPTGSGASGCIAPAPSS